MGITSLSVQYGMTHTVGLLRSELNDLQMQLGTGQVSQTYGGLGEHRVTALATHAEVSRLEGYIQTAEDAILRLDLVQTSLERIDTNMTDTQGDLRNIPYEPNIEGQTLAQATASDRLEEMIQLLNSRNNGRYLFAGRTADQAPVVSYSEMLDGSGVKAGLRQVIDERKQADMGADGRGRLVIPAAAGATVSLSEDVAGSPFGLKLESINSQLTGTSENAPAGSPPSMGVTFSATLPEAGEKIDLDFVLPDGTEGRITLTATDQSPPEDGQFLIGSDAATTASNFQSALTGAVETFVQEDMAAASALQASTDFFNISSGSPAQRVDGPPFDTATSLKDATAADTVSWYTGELDGNPRDSSLARVDTGYTISYGARADEEALRESVRYLAVLSVETFDTSVATDEQRYNSLSIKVANGISAAPGEQSIASLQSQLGYKQGTLNSLKERHTSAIEFAESMLADVEQVNEEEVGMRMLKLLTLLEASYQTTANISQLNLASYI